jgi:hypothetical protein
MRRLFREPSEMTRERMSKAHQGITKSDKTKQRISASMKKYWERIPSNKETQNSRANEAEQI